MADETILDHPLCGIASDAKEVELVGILKGLSRKVRFGGWKCEIKVGRQRSLRRVKVTIDLQAQDVPAPAVLQRLLDVPEALVRILHLLHKLHDVSPRQIVQQLLHNLFFGPRFRESTHVHQVAHGKPAHLRQCMTQVRSESVDHFRAPSLLFLTRKNRSPDAPIEPDQFAIYRYPGAKLCRAHLGHELAKEFVVAIGFRNKISHSSLAWRWGSGNLRTSTAPLSTSSRLLVLRALPAHARIVEGRNVASMKAGDAAIVS